MFRLNRYTLIALLLAAPMHATTVSLGSATASCGVPVTLPVSIGGQVGGLYSVQYRVVFDPQKAAFNEFTIDPIGSLPGYFSDARVLAPGSVEMLVRTEGDRSSSVGVFGTLSFSMLSTAAESVKFEVVDVLSLDASQGTTEPGTGKSGTVTSSCSKDQRGRSEVYRYTVLAGSSGGGGWTDGGEGVSRFVRPDGVAVVATDTFVTDSGAHVIRRISSDGIVSTWAGSPGRRGTNDGVRTAARFDSPAGLLALPDGSLLVADRGNFVIRHISPDGTVTTWAGNGDPGNRDGKLLSSQFVEPTALAIEPSGDILIADQGTCTLKRASVDRITTIAGKAFTCGVQDGLITSALFDGMSAVMSHPTLGILIADHRNHIIRRIATDTTVSIYAGSKGDAGTRDGSVFAARFDTPRGMVLLPEDGFLIGTSGGIRRVTPTKTVETLAGSGSRGYLDGAAAAARFDGIAGVAIDGDGTVFLADADNTVIRRISADVEVDTIAGAPNLKGDKDDAGPAARFDRPWQIAADSQGNLYVADRGNKCVRRVTPDGNVTVWAGIPGVSGGKDGARLEATFQDPAGCAFDANGNLWISEPSAHVLRMIRPTGEVLTVAGSRGTTGFIDGPSLSARFRTPMQLAGDQQGNVLVADAGNNAIRIVSAEGAVLTFAGARDGSAGGEDGSPNVARFDTPTGIAIDGSGGVVVADRGNHTIREIRNGRVSTIAVVTGRPGQADGAPPNGRFVDPEGVSVLPDGSILVAESSGRIRRLTRAGVVSTLAGRYQTSGNQPGLGVDALFATPVSLMAIGERTFVVSDSTNHNLRRATFCAEDALCLGGARFAVTLDATDPRSGASAEGIPLAESDLLGFFSLPGLTGNPANPEVFVKVLDGTGVNGKFWVFYGGLTDFEFDLDVHDRMTGFTQSYKKPGLEFCGGADTSAFALGPVAVSSKVVDRSVISRDEQGGECGESLLCLVGGRFRVDLVARDPRTEAVAEGVAIPRTGDFGYFSLPGLTGNASNPEVFVKVLDGRGVNGRFWVFYGGLTDFEFTLEVTDEESGLMRTYSKPGLDFCGGADTNAF